MRYRQAGTINWTPSLRRREQKTQICWGMRRSDTDNPIDFGSDWSSRITLETLGGNGGLHKLTAAIDDMNLSLWADGSRQFHLRKASSKPTTSTNLSTYGTLVASSSSSGSSQHVNAWTSPLSVVARRCTEDLVLGCVGCVFAIIVW